jgi:hypothetical protein
MPGEEPRTWNAIIGSRYSRSTGVQTGQSRLHGVREQNTEYRDQNDPCSEFRLCLIRRRTMRSSDPCLLVSVLRSGGADRDRTDDLKLAKLALSQLSYGPGTTMGRSALRMVGPGRVERPTSRLSGVRSNHLSYEPETRRPFSRATGFRITSPSQSQTGADTARPCVPLAQAFDGRKGNEDGGRPPLCLQRCFRLAVRAVQKTSSLERR